MVGCTHLRPLNYFVSNMALKDSFQHLILLNKMELYNARIKYYMRIQVVYYNISNFQMHGRQNLSLQPDMSLIKLLQQLWNDRH